MTCFECRQPAKELHHIIPKSLGGTRMVPLCAECHCKIHGVTGNRINATDLVKFGMYKKEAFRLISIWAWQSDKVVTRLSKADQFKSYNYYSGDYKLDIVKFFRRYKTVAEWSKQKRWSWFLQLASEHNWTNYAAHMILAKNLDMKKYRKMYALLHAPVLNVDDYQEHVGQCVISLFDVKDSRLKFMRDRPQHECIYIEKQNKAKNAEMMWSLMRRFC